MFSLKLDFQWLLVHQQSFEASGAQIQVLHSRKPLFKFDKTSKYRFSNRKTRLQFLIDQGMGKRRSNFRLSIFAIDDLAFLFLNVLYTILQPVKFSIEQYIIVEVFLIVRGKVFYENRNRSMFAQKSTGNNDIFCDNSAIS